MKKQAYDAYFEKLYDEFIHETDTEIFGAAHYETLESFLRNAARRFYDQGKLLRPASK